MKKIEEASKAIAEAVKMCKPQVIPLYPITPQTHIVERLADLINNGELDATAIDVESEHSAISAAIGVSAAGSRVFTATSSQGLALMHEILFIASGMRMPIVMAVANRALSAPINIWCFSKDARVLMKDMTYKPIMDIRVGEEVIGKDKKGNLIFTKVKKLFKREVDNLVEIKTNNFSLICTPEHEFYYHPTHNHWISAKNLKNKKLHWLGYGFEENIEFKRGWLTGTADGDGCFFKDKKNRFSFILKVKDKEMVETFIKWSKELDFDIKEVDYNKKRGFFTARLTKNKETLRLKKFLEKSKGLDFCRGYLAGIYDAEGSGPHKCKQAVIYNSNPSIVEFVTESLKNLNISFKVYTDKRRGDYYKRDNYHIKINNVPEFFIKCRPIIKRKRENLLRTTIKSIKSRLNVLDVVEINKNMDVYNLETEAHNYIVNGLLVHNCDHSDTIAERDSGWIQFYCESTQEAADTIIQAYKIAEDKNVLLPVMVCIDGFTLSHVYENVDMPEQKQVDSFLPKFKPIIKLDSKKPITFGPIGPPDMYMEVKQEQQKVILDSKDVIKKVQNEFKTKFGRDYDLIEEYKSKDADTILIGMGTLCGTSRVVIDEMRKKGKKVGMVKIRCFRPFPEEDLIKACKKAKNIAVVDRDISFGSKGAVYLEVKDCLNDKNVKNYIMGLGGRDITPKHIEKALEFKGVEVTWLT